MAKTITLNHNGNTVNRQIGTKAENDPIKFANRVNILKFGFAESLVTKRWLDEGIISLEKNCLTNEEGVLVPHLVKASVTPQLYQQFEKEIEEVASEISVQ